MGVSIHTGKGENSRRKMFTMASARYKELAYTEIRLLLHHLRPSFGRDEAFGVPSKSCDDSILHGCDIVSSEVVVCVNTAQGYCSFHIRLQPTYGRHQDFTRCSEQQASMYAWRKYVIFTDQIAFLGHIIKLARLRIRSPTNELFTT